MWGKVKLGINTISDTTGVIEIDGTEVVGLEMGTDGGFAARYRWVLTAKDF